jgi:hypothetical protein
MKMNPKLLTVSLDATVVCANPSGWIDASLFSKTCGKRDQLDTRNQGNTKVPILDGHTSHKNLSKPSNLPN